ncbi:hypothetical protein Esti_001464 [Eimeria stiedai]
MVLTERGAPSSMRWGPGPAGVLQSFAMWVLVSGALTFCFRASNQTPPAGALEPSHQALIESEEKAIEEKWLLPFVILLAFVVGAAVAILVIYIANVRSLRKREAVAAKQAAPELFQVSDDESPTPRDRRGIWEPNNAAQLEEEGEVKVPEGSY